MYSNIKRFKNAENICKKNVMQNFNTNIIQMSKSLTLTLGNQQHPDDAN